jgi:hypothetical protein
MVKIIMVVTSMMSMLCDRCSVIVLCYVSADSLTPSFATVWMFVFGAAHLGNLWTNLKDEAMKVTQCSMDLKQK